MVPPDNDAPPRAATAPRPQPLLSLFRADLLSTPFMLASISSQHVESDSRIFGNPLRFISITNRSRTAGRAGFGIYLIRRRAIPALVFRLVRGPGPAAPHPPIRAT